MPAKGLLSGIVIADFSRVLAGPLATMILADMGAEVLKIERPGSGDETRRWGPPYASGGDSTYYLSVNRNKRSIEVDFATPDGNALAMDLARTADVVVENLRPGVMDRYSLGYDHVKRANPSVVYCSIEGIGPADGTLPGYDFLAQAVSGLMSITGKEDDEPLKSGVAVVDVMTGLYAAVGILGALFERTRSGEGQHVRIDLLSTAIAGLVNQASAYLNTGEAPTRMGNDHPSIVPYGVYRTATEPIAIAVGTDRQFRKLCAVLSIDQATESKLTSNSARVRHRAELRSVLETALSKQPAADWLALLEGSDIPASAIYDIKGAFDYAAQIGMEPIVRLVDSGGQESVSVANPMRFSRCPIEYVLPPPRLGEHTDEIVHRYGSAKRDEESA